jgi:hypothetical protein
VAYLLDRFQPAILVLRGMLRREPNNAEGYRLLALSPEGLGESADVGDAFRQAMRLYRGGPPDEDPGIDYRGTITGTTRVRPTLSFSLLQTYR